MRRIFEEYSSGKSTKAIAAGLNADRIPAPKVVKYNKASFRCGKANKGACSNRKGISRRRLEQRVFDTLRAVFQSEEMRRRFVAEYEAERAGLRDGTVEADLSRLETQRATAHRGLDGIMTAIAEGAPYATFKAKAEALQAEVDALTARVAEKQAKIANQASVVEDPSQAYDRAVQQIKNLLSEEELVDEANTYLSMLIKRITLTENTTAKHGVEIRINLANAALLPTDDVESSQDCKATTVIC